MENTVEKMTDELLPAVREIQSSNKFILKRLNQLFNDRDGHCSCSRTQEKYQQEIANLQYRVSELEQTVKENEESRRGRERQIESLKESMVLLETSILAVQTDDSKLRSASLRSNKEGLKAKEYSADQANSKSHTNGKDERLHVFGTERIRSGERHPTGQVTRVSPVEYANDFSDKLDIPKDNSLPEITGGDNGELQDGAIGGTKISSSGQTAANKVFTTAYSSQQEKWQASRPNFEANKSGSESNPGQKKVEVINDPIRKSYGDEQLWRLLAQQELENGKVTLKDLGGIHSVICLDISASMAEGKSWTEATTFLQEYLSGLEHISSRYGLPEEHVALVTFGHKTEVQQRLTNSYGEIQTLIGQQKLGGPTPLYGGLVLGLAAAGSSEKTIAIINVVQVLTKIIIITDGHMTEVGQYAGPDTTDVNMDETHAKILQCMEEYKNSRIDTFIVPVGNANHEFLGLMSAVAEGRMLSHKSGNELARRSYITTKIVDPLGLFQGSTELFLGADGSNLSVEDKRIMEDIRSDAKKRMRSGFGKTDNNKYMELPDKNLAPIGSRVRRGPDWKWEVQDSYGPGTVIGHDHGEQVWVEWDVDDHQNVYRYGNSGYDVLIVEEPRSIQPGQKPAVGCTVRQTRIGHQSPIGTVIKLDEMNDKATVLWNDGKRGDYSYGEAGKGEIEVCTGFQPFQSEGHVLGSDTPIPKPVEKKTRNKNKNIH